MKRAPFNVILLGDPGAGKATQAAKLAKKYQMVDIDMGKMLRSIQDPKLDKKYKLRHNLQTGRLTRTALVRELLHRSIADAPAAKGLLFDGTPKMLGEAKLVSKWLREEKRSDPFFVYLGIPQKEMLKRLASRVEVVAGKKRIRQEDKDMKAVKERMRYYYKDIAAVIAFFKARYAYRRISGLGTREEVSRRLVAAIEKFRVASEK